MDRRRWSLGFVNFLTLVRCPLVLVFFALALVHTQTAKPWLFVVAFVSLTASAITDLFDGYFARRLQVETRFGAHADPLMDKFFALSTMPLLVFVASQNGHIRHAMVLLVLTLLFLSRDQWVTFLRSVGSMYNVSGHAHWSGKLRTGINFPLICTVYFFEAGPSHWLAPWIVYTFEAAGFVVNLGSIYAYTRRYWPCLVKAVSSH
jgi:CDP-diacylglycerol---glycerol-3-phosphate 3-phosphatidyltransferase